LKNRIWIIIILIAAAVLLLCAFWIKGKRSGHIANVYKDGKCIHSVDLRMVGKPYSFTVQDEDGHENVIEVEKGKIRVASANCPDQICVEMGWLSNGITPIVCMPARLSINLEYDPADIPIFIGTFAFGPTAGVIITILVSVIQGTTVSAGGQIWGIIMHIAATGSFCIVAGNLYKFHKSKKGAIIALIAGVVTMVAVMCLANLIITPIYTGMPRAAVAAMIPTIILPFNLIKAGANAAITFMVYKRISHFLHD
jgi:riboflavin transporter FmnP